MQKTLDRPVTRVTANIAATMVILGTLFVGVIIVSLWTATADLKMKRAESERRRAATQAELDARNRNLTAVQRELELLRSKARGVADKSGILTFWPKGVVRSQEGYLVTERQIPIRAIARFPNAPLFTSEDLGFPDGVVAIMRPWLPYYVFEWRGKSILLGERADSPPAERKWARKFDCFCWTTRECLNIEEPLQVYRSLANAESQDNSLQDSYTYSFNQHFMRGKSKEETKSQFRMAALPVLHRHDGAYWCFVRPEGDEGGYGVCWVKWEGDDHRACCRIRSTRRELETYIAGLYQLLRDYESPAMRADATLGLYTQGVGHLTRARVVQDAQQTEVMRQGIPKLVGYLEYPITSPLQYDKVKKRVLALMAWSNRFSEWDVNEVTYMDVAMLP